MKHKQDFRVLLFIVLLLELFGLRECIIRFMLLQYLRYF
jgi:hypothetical protein